MPSKNIKNLNFCGIEVMRFEAYFANGSDVLRFLLPPKNIKIVLKLKQIISSVMLGTFAQAEIIIL